MERPARLKAQFSAERISNLRFDKSLIEPMKWAFERFGEQVYSNLKSLEKELLEWCEKNNLDLNSKKRKALVSLTTWNKQREILVVAHHLMSAIGTSEYLDYNIFLEEVNQELKASGTKLSASEKNQHDVRRRLGVRTFNLDLHVKSAGPQDGRIDHVLAIGSTKDDDVLESLNAVKLAQQLGDDGVLDIAREPGASSPE